MDKKQREALVIAMLEKGESYRDIAQKASIIADDTLSNKFQ